MGNEIVKTKPEATLKTLLQGDRFKHEISQVLPKLLTPERFVRVACTILTRTPKLEKCEPYSFFNSLLTLAQFGLEPDGRRAHLIPFENRKRNCVECQLIIDYKGLVELVLRSGTVSFLHADVICENDVFDYSKGELKDHKIDFKKARGAVYAAYALCRNKDGTEKVEVMTKDEIEGIRARSRAGSNGPWVTDWNEMAKKTVFRRLSKWLTLSPELRDAVEQDDDQLEENRFKAAKPVFDAAPSFLTPPPPEPEQIEAPKQPLQQTAPPEDERELAEVGLAPEQPKQQPANVIPMEPQKTNTQATEQPSTPPQTQEAPKVAPDTAERDKALIETIAKGMTQHGVNWDQVADWLVEKKWLKSRCGDVEELVNVSPRKAKMLVDSFAKIAEQIKGAK